MHLIVEMFCANFNNKYRSDYPCPCVAGCCRYRTIALRCRKAALLCLLTTFAILDKPVNCLRIRYVRRLIRLVSGHHSTRNRLHRAGRVQMPHDPGHRTRGYVPNSGILHPGLIINAWVNCWKRAQSKKRPRPAETNCRNHSLRIVNWV